MRFFVLAVCQSFGGRSCLGTNCVAKKKHAHSRLLPTDESFCHIKSQSGVSNVRSTVQSITVFFTQRQNVERKKGIGERRVLSTIDGLV
jgi:hypothetical protein